MEQYLVATTSSHWISIGFEFLDDRGHSFVDLGTDPDEKQKQTGEANRHTSRKDTIPDGESEDPLGR